MTKNLKKKDEVDMETEKFDMEQNHTSSLNGEEKPLIGDQKPSSLCSSFRFFFAFFLFSTPTIGLSVVSMVLSTHDIGCNHKDPMGLDVSDYLLGSGVAGLNSFLLYFSIFYVIFRPSASSLFPNPIYILLTLFHMVWSVIGGLILFRSNLDCIDARTPEVIYALVMWCYFAVTILMGYKRVFFPDHPNETN